MKRHEPVSHYNCNVAIVVISLFGLLFDAIFMRVRQRLLPWYREA